MTYRKQIKIFCSLPAIFGIQRATSISAAISSVSLALMPFICGCTTHRLIDRNAAAGRQLAIMFKTRENTVSDIAFPRSLSELSEDLRAMGLNQPLPRCECRDGTLREFLYISGFTAIDDQRSVFLVSPPEMGLDRAILICINAKVLILPNSQADELIRKSREFVSKRDESQRK